MTTTGQGRDVHLVGSVPMASNEEVFRTVGAALGDRLKRISDGETGDRGIWINFQLNVLLSSPGLGEAPTEPDAYPGRPRVRPRPGVRLEDVRINPLGYARAAIDSYAVFARLKREGVLPDHLRFQVGFPTPISPISAFVAWDHRAQLEPHYEAAIAREVEEVCAAIPHDHLAIQWELVREFAILEGVNQAYFDDPEEGIHQRVRRVTSRVPEGVHMGYHLCYGDYGARHFIQPKDMGHLVRVANRIAAEVSRPIQWVHMPVPQDRADDAYFAPLKDLRLRPETELYLGLVHYEDGAEGARRRMAAAQKVVPSFGVATECGWGRRPPEQAPELLRIHREVSGGG